MAGGRLRRDRGAPNNIGEDDLSSGRRESFHVCRNCGMRKAGAFCANGRE